MSSIVSNIPLLYRPVYLNKAFVMWHYLSKMRGGAVCPPRASLHLIALAGLGGIFAIAAVASLSQFAATPLILGSFGATCVLVFGFPESPFSQPRNVIVGHLLSSLTGLICLSVFGSQWWSIALAVGAAIALMMLTRAVHPPAGSNPDSAKPRLRGFALS